jgi:hypothetical protein
MHMPPAPRRRCSRGACPPVAAMAWAAAAACSAGVAAEAQPVGAADPLTSFTARYEGSKRLVLLTARAHASLRLQRSKQHIVYTMDTRVKLAFIERAFHDCSVIRIDGERLLPLQYLHRDHADPDLDVRTRFDWALGQASTRLGRQQEATTLPLAWPTWDPMSLQVALMAAASRHAAGGTETHRAVERGVLKMHQVQFAGPVQAPQGPVYEVTSRKAGSDDAPIVLLLTPQPAWQPLRITIEGVTIERVGAGPAGDPPDLPDDAVPQCSEDGPPGVAP